MLKVGIIGCGSIFTMHATSCDHLENATLIGVCDIKKERADAAAAKYNVKAYYDYQELIDVEKPDVVHVCVPHYLHPIISRYALEHGVNVLCEKPMSIRHLSNRGHSIMEVDDTGEGFIRYRHGATLSFWAMNNYGCDDPIEIRLLCEKGKVVMSYDDAIITFHDGTVLSTSTQNDGIYYEGGKDYWGFQHIRQIADFYDAVEHDREPRISGEEALKIQKLICEIYEKGSWK